LVSEPKPCQFTHDGAGAISQEVRGTSTFTYTYDRAGRLSQANQGATILGTYTHDGLERLAVRVAGSVTRRYIDDLAGQLLAEIDPVSGTVAEHIWMGDRPLAFVRDVNTTPVVLFATVDHLGRVLELRDGTRTVIWSLVTQPFGEQHALTGTTPFLGRYPGQWHQAETGLAHNWHRVYDPTLGRYLEADPLGLMGDARQGPRAGMAAPGGRFVSAPGFDTRLFAGVLSAMPSSALALARTSPDFGHAGHPDGPSMWGYARGAPGHFGDPRGEDAFMATMRRALGRNLLEVYAWAPSVGSSQTPDCVALGKNSCSPLIL
jgi:RHS repeat-associated protein